MSFLDDAVRLARGMRKMSEMHEEALRMNLARDRQKQTHTRQDTTRYLESKEDIKPIKGQEAICPDGLGRVKEWGYAVARVDNEWNWVRVDTYIDNRGCKWDRHNVELIDPRQGKVLVMPKALT